MYFYLVRIRFQGGWRKSGSGGALFFAVPHLAVGARSDWDQGRRAKDWDSWGRAVEGIKSDAEINYSGFALDVAAPEK